MVLYEIFTVGKFTSQVNVPSALLLIINITAPLSVSFVLLLFFFTTSRHDQDHSVICS